MATPAPHSVTSVQSVAMSALVIEHRPGHPVAVLLAVGTLSLATVAELRRAARTALTEQPELLVVDITGVSVEDDVTLAALPMIARQGAGAGTDVIVATDDREPLTRLGIDRGVPVLGSVAAAVEEHAQQPGPRRIEATLQPGIYATSRARALVDRACTQWGVREHVDAAALIVTELVANAVLHARTPMRVSVTLRRRHLHLAVRDGSRQRARRTGEGRGLLIVEGLAASWGTIGTYRGKTVWATLHIDAGR